MLFNAFHNCYAIWLFKSHSTRLLSSYHDQIIASRLIISVNKCITMQPSCIANKIICFKQHNTATSTWVLVNTAKSNDNSTFKIGHLSWGLRVWQRQHSSLLKNNEENRRKKVERLSLALRRISLRRRSIVNTSSQFEMENILISIFIISLSVVHTVADDHHSAGTWKKQMTWKSRWVKTYKPKTVYVGQWWVCLTDRSEIRRECELIACRFVCRKRVWTPAWVSEYVPKHSIPWKHTNAVVHHY